MAGPFIPRIRLDADERIVEAECTCGFYQHNKLHKGPCAHMLALRRAFDRDRAQSGGPTVVAGPGRVLGERQNNEQANRSGHLAWPLCFG